jgi:hypothetical protein
MQPRTRRVQRIHFQQPLIGRLGTTEVALVDLSVLGARLEHRAPLAAGGHSRISFGWDGETIAAECRVVRTRAAKGDDPALYHSGIEFEELPRPLRETIRRLIEVHLRRALDEQRRAAQDVILPPFEAMASIDNGYVCLMLESHGWLRKRTHDPGQPPEGFTVSADETDAQVELLRAAYERSDREGRKLIQLFAQLSIVDAEGNPVQGERVVGLAQ